MIFNPWVLLGALVAALGIFVAGHTVGVKNTKLNYENAIKGQKLEAASLLAAKVKENADREETDRQTSIANQKDYDEKLKILVADRDQYRANGLRFRAERSGICSGGTGKEGGTSTGATQDVSVEVKLPDAIGSDLRKLADEADALAVWGESCHKRVNQK